MRVCIFSREVAFAQREGPGGGAEEPRWPYRTPGGCGGEREQDPEMGEKIRKGCRHKQAAGHIPDLSPVNTRACPAPGSLVPLTPTPHPKAHISKEIIVMSENKGENMKVQTLTKYIKFLTRKRGGKLACCEGLSQVKE